MSKMSSKKNLSQSSIFSFFAPINQTKMSNGNSSIQKTFEKRSHKEIMDDDEDSKRLEKELASNKKSFPPKSKKEKEEEIIVKKMENNIDSLLNDIHDVNNSKKKLVKSKNKNKIITDSDDNDSEFKTEKEKENHGNGEKFTPVKTNKKKKKRKMSKEKEEEDNESSNDGIDLNNFLKETLDNELAQNPNSLDININKTFQGTSILSQNKSENENTPSNHKKGKNQSRSRSRSRSRSNNKKKNKKKKNDNGEELEDAEEDNNESVISNEDALAKKDFFANPHDALPEFLKPENIKDKNGNRPDSPDYDNSTLYVPPDFIKKQTPAMKQFWDFKSKNFDKVLFFKLGKFYELFFDDAIIGNQILDLNWMGNDPKKLHVGFPEKILESKAEKLVAEGFKIAVIEQTETPDQLKSRVKSGEKGDKTIKRELCNVLTKGTYYKYDNENNNSGAKNDNSNSQNNLRRNYNLNKNKFCCTLFCQPKENKLDGGQFLGSHIDCFSRTVYEWGICLFDVTTLKFYLGKIEEDSSKFIPRSQGSQTTDNTFNKIKTILYNLAPEEIICVKQNIPESISSFINDLTAKPIVTHLKYNYKFNELNDLCQKYFGKDFQKWDPVIIRQFSNEALYHVSCVSLYLTINYLERLLIAKNTLPTSTFYDYDGDITLNPNKKMIIDYQAINNLELIQTKLDPRNPEAGSLVEYLNKAVSPFGKRLLRNWILNPLCDVKKINDRLDMVEDFLNNDEIILKFRNSLSKWMDIERQCTKFYRLAKGTNSQAIYFEDVNKNRLKEFFKLLNFLYKCQNIFEMFEQYIENDKFKSKELIEKLTINEGIPDLSSVIKVLLNDFHMVEILDSKDNTVLQIESKPGVYPEYDECKEDIKNIKKNLDDILQKEKKRLKCAIIQYAHTKNYRYELEIPESYVKNNRPEGYILTTSKKGYLRFHTKEIIQNVEQLEELEEQLKEVTKNLNTELFRHFYNQHKIINDFINAVAEIDCLTSLAFISAVDPDKFSRPKFIDISQNNGYPYIELKDCVHPCLLERTPYFVPNDITLGKDGKSLIVMTGPNMGGKSTLLRQVCVAAIIAQIGCYVPAKSCVMTIVDRIFTRIGASDKLIEGKSTFYIEMEETKNIIENATINSLIIMDELGRGTSTKDGKIIAKTILYQIEHRLKSRCLFTTHYHDIIEWCQNEPKMDLFFMDSSVNNETKDITFLYKFKQGICPESYGIEVAKLAGIPGKVIVRANEIKENNILDIQ
jgi:DNA mismatch repair protein MSH6